MNKSTGKNSGAKGIGWHVILNYRYRLSVIRALPQLQKLDNIQVTPEEIKDAQRKGKVLTHPDDPQESEEEYVPAPQYTGNRYQDYPAEPEYSNTPQRSPTRQEVCFCLRFV